MSENQDTKAVTEEKSPCCCAQEASKAAAPATQAPSKSFLTVLIVIIVAFVLIWLGFKWYNGEFNSGNVVEIELPTEVIPGS